MNLLIWGTGACAKATLSEYGMGYLRNHKILAFIDNDEKKIGKKFYDKEIIAPSMISGYSFSQILICSKTFEKEIVKQLIKELKIKRNLIMTLDEMIEVYYRDLVEKQSLLKRKILVVGTATEWNAREVLFRCLFNICGFVEIQTLEKINNFKFDYIMLTNLMQATTLDRRKGRLELEKM